MLRQLLLESLLLSAAGGAGGLLIAAAAVNLFGASADDWLPAGGAIAIVCARDRRRGRTERAGHAAVRLAPAWFAASAAPEACCPRAAATCAVRACAACC
jgi:hypothetical protein